jgi:hypothetical protein
MAEFNTTITTTTTNTIMNNTNIFDFIKDPQKLNLLTQANETLKIDKNRNNTIIFVYSAPKVGSTSIVSSLRIFGLDKVDIIHIHDEEMLKVLAHIKDITVNELILFNKYLGKNVYVINVYRSPIERKISAFFEKIGAYHFNNHDQNVNNYSITKVINRFNNIFPYIGIGDHFIDKYNIQIPECFDFNNKFLLVKENDISYITLRLKDSNEWGNILTNIFGFKICIIKDYESSKKPIKDLYKLFKSQYRVPRNLLENEMNSKYLNYYYSPLEIQNYYNEWSIKSMDNRDSYTSEQYKLYEEITIENTHIDFIQFDHYMDEGCLCKACSIKRREFASNLINGIPVNERLIHTEAKTDLIKKRVIQANKINQAINQSIKNNPRKVSGKDFKQDMSSVVKGKRL